MFGLLGTCTQTPSLAAHARRARRRWSTKHSAELCAQTLQRLQLHTEAIARRHARRLPGRPLQCKLEDFGNRTSSVFALVRVCVCDGRWSGRGIQGLRLCLIIFSIFHRCRGARCWVFVISHLPGCRGWEGFSQGPSIVGLAQEFASQHWHMAEAWPGPNHMAERKVGSASGPDWPWPAGSIGHLRDPPSRLGGPDGTTRAPRDGDSRRRRDTAREKPRSVCATRRTTRMGSGLA